MSIRSEAYEFGDALARGVIKATDDVPNKEEGGALLKAAYDVVVEGTDFVKVPQAERFEAIILGLSRALSLVVEAKISFSDE